MKQKLIAMMLMVVLVCACLTGCGGGKEAGEKDSSASSEGKKDLTIWITYDAESAVRFEEITKKFNESNDKYYMNVEVVGTKEQARQKMVGLKPEQYPSIFMGGNDSIYEYAAAEYVVPIQKYLDKDEDKWTDDMFDVVRNAYSDQNGDMVGGVVGISAKGYLVNVDLLKAAGYTLEDVTSFEKVAEIATAANSKGLCKYGYMPYGGYDILDMLTYQGVDIIDAGNGYSGTATKCLYGEGETNASLKKMLSLMAGMYESGAADVASSTSTVRKTAFVNQQLVFWGCTNSSIYFIADLDLDFEWAFVPFTGIDDNAKYKDCAIVEGTGAFIANTGDEEEMQGAYEFIKFFSQPEAQIAWCTFRGYVPYTNAAAKDEAWTTWRDENFPSADALVDKMMKAPDELKLPYTKAMSRILTENTTLFENIGTNPKGDLDEYIKTAVESIDKSIAIVNMRGN